ncbi:MAG: DNA repair protein RecO [Lachnospiraceae bacterium]|jgi:DNA repair protein RecO (recombination protein O)|nr:DNA repair protein RecO [Lachnospiraceae bacterium]
MNEEIHTVGMVIGSMPVGEADKRLVLLTKELGKVVVFAKGVKKVGAAFMAQSRIFAFGEFVLIRGRDSYRLIGAKISRYFEEVSADVERMCYGQYFLEFADYYTHENMESGDMLLLLYQSLRALVKENIPNDLVKSTFELRAMAINGEYTEGPPLRMRRRAVAHQGGRGRGQPDGGMAGPGSGAGHVDMWDTGTSDTAVETAVETAWAHVLSAPIGSLYTFALSDGVLQKFRQNVGELRERFIDRKFRSLDILEKVRGHVDKETVIYE